MFIFQVFSVIFSVIFFSRNVFLYHLGNGVAAQEKKPYSVGNNKVKGSSSPAKRPVGAKVSTLANMFETVSFRDQNMLFPRPGMIRSSHEVLTRLGCILACFYVHTFTFFNNFTLFPYRQFHVFFESIVCPFLQLYPANLWRISFRIFVCIPRHAMLFHCWVFT